MGRLLIDYKLCDVILEGQIDSYDPDVIINTAICSFQKVIAHSIKRRRVVIGVHDASPLPKHCDFESYDLLLFSSPSYVKEMKQKGMNAGYIRFGFYTPILEQVSDWTDKICLSFIGSLQPEHTNRIQWLEKLCEKYPIKIWARWSGWIPRKSPIWTAYQGELYGLDMFNVLNNSLISLNKHIDTAGEYADNMRLFEATGVGSMLITDWKRNLRDFFDKEEVVSYTSLEDCMEKISYYLDHPDEQRKVASKGQRRTAAEHLYLSRAKDLINYIESLSKQ
jgi:hypothetical protein